MDEPILIKTKDNNAAALVSVINTALSTSGDVVKQLLQASMSNPLMAAVSALIIANILQRANVIDQNTALGIDVLVFAGAGVAITNEILQDFTKIFSLTGNGNPSLLTPSANVLVLGSDISQAQLNALLAGIKK